MELVYIQSSWDDLADLGSEPLGQLPIDIMVNIYSCIYLFSFSLY